MAYEFTNKPFKWTKNGQDPTQAEIDLGLQGGMALPADFVNQQWSKTYKAIDETQSVVSTLASETVRAGAADANEQNQLYKTVGGTSTNIDPKCSLATKANRVNINTASTSANVELPLLAPGTQVTDAIYKIDEITYNPSKDQLTTPNFSGALNTIAINQGASTGWRKIAEFDNQDSTNITQALTILVLDGDSKGSTGTGIITIKTHSENDGTAPTNLSASLQIDYMSGVGTLFSTDNYKLTYTVNGLTVTYKFWVKISVAYQGDIFQLLNAASPSQQKNIINRVTFARGTFSSGATGYMTDGDVAATGVIDCEMGTIGNDVSGNAATATKLSGAQTVLYESTTNTNSFTLSGLFTDWSAVMIYLTGEWASGTAGTHGFLVPLKHLKTAGNIIDFCGTKAINFVYTDDDSMRWFEKQAAGAMSYSSVKVVGIG